VHAPLRLGVQLRVLDRLRDLRAIATSSSISPRRTRAG
jgi:hypothetical protein